MGVLKAAKVLKPGQRCVVILADSIRNYMTKFLRSVLSGATRLGRIECGADMGGLGARNGSDDWMRENGFMPPAQLPDAVDANDAYKGATVADLKLPAAITIKADVRQRDTGPAAATPGADVDGVEWRAGAQPQTTAKEAIAIMRDKGMD